MQAVTAAFHAAEEADVNQPVAKVQLALGNYASAAAFGATVTSSGDDSADYPAAGATDDDRTELNIGPASGADNGVGKSSWKSNVTPDETGNTYIEIDFGTSRTFNRLKVYQREGHGIHRMAFQYWDGAEFVYFIEPPVVVVDGYDTGGYGDTPYNGSLTGGFVSSEELDVIDFDDVTTTKIRVIVLEMVNPADKAEIVEVEVYRLIDISDRVTGVTVNRARDYKLQNNIAAAAEVRCDNSDRFFSPNYVPTAAEVVAGFVNSELRPGLIILIDKGFRYGGGAYEYAPQFTGTTDAIRVSSANREATIPCRDYIKGLLDQIESANLRENQDIGDLIIYMLNLGNISSWEIDADTTTIDIDSFFTLEESLLTTIQKLVQASGDAAFYFDESGIATFRMYLNSVPQEFVTTTQAQWEAGTVLDSIDTENNPGAISGPLVLYDDFRDGDLSDPTWTINVGSSSVVVSTGYVTLGGSNSAILSAIGQATGTWHVKVRPNPVTGLTSFIYFAHTTPANLDTGTGYRLNIGNDGTFALFRDGVLLATTTITPLSNGAWSVVRITRDGSGVINVYVNGTFILTATDTTYSNTGMALRSQGNSGLGSTDFTDVYRTTKISPFEATFESAVIDQSADIDTEGIFQATYITSAGSTVAFFTATSANGISFDAYVAATPGAAIASTTRRYIKFKAVLTKLITDLDPSTPTIYDVTINWITGAGSQKYPSSVSFFVRFDSTALDLQLEQSDNLGGDTAILNDVQVTSAPPLLTGADTDITWQGTTGVPAEAVSVTNQLAVAPGIYTYRPVIQSGMDVSRMTGANPAAAAITFAGGAAGTWAFSFIHPTKPVLVITVTIGGTITKLEVQGKVYSATQTPYQAAERDTSSIALNKKRSLSINNDYIINNGIALLIAERLIFNYADPVTYLPELKTRTYYSVQLGDRINVVDDNTGLDADFYCVGITHVYEVGEEEIEAYTVLVLIKIPVA